MEEENQKQSRQLKLSVKIGICIVLFASVLVIATVLVGDITFQESLKKQYNESAYRLATAASHYFTKEQFARYAKILKKLQAGEISSEEAAKVAEEKSYQESRNLVMQLRRDIEANDIYIFLLDLEELEKYTPETQESGEWRPLYYISDCYAQEEKSYTFGYCGAVYPPYIKTLRRLQETGKKTTKEYFISDTQYGYNITAVLPVVHEGETVALVSVEIPMKTLQSDINRFRSRQLFVSVMVLVLSLVGMLYLIMRLVVKPLYIIAGEASSFVSESTVVSEKLSTIRTHDEIQVLAESILALEKNVNLYIKNLRQVTAEKERISAELNIATRIQADMLPRVFPAFPDRSEFDLYASMDPAKEVGGDFYDYFLVDDDHLMLVVADVSGKGVPAALFMVIAKTLIKNRAQMGGSPAEILESVNNQLCETNEATLFVTVWLAILEISTGKGMAANAGHEHPALRRADGVYELVVYNHSPAIALMPDISFEEHEFELHPGDSLYVYTDGVAEARNAQQDFFGTGRMLAVLNREPDASPEKILQNMKREISGFVLGTPQFDDLTMLCLRYEGKKED